MEDEKIMGKRKESVITFLIGLGVFIFLVVIVGMKFYDPEKSLKTLWIIFSIVAGVGVVASIGINSQAVFKRGEKDEDEKPKVMDDEQIMAIIEDVAYNNFKNNIKLENGIVPISTETIHRDQIYAYKLNMNLDNESCILIINATHSTIKPTILPPDTSDQKIKTAMNKKATKPFDEPDSEVTEEKNPLLGTEKTTVKKIHNKNKEDKKPKEDVA